MKRGILFCMTVLAALLMLAAPALAGGFDGLTPPTILSFDPETLAITWDEPDKPESGDSPAWDNLGYYSLRIYYADHALTEAEWPAQELEVPSALTFVGSQRIGAKNSPSGVIKRNWLTQGNGFYYFAVSAMTTSGEYILKDEGGEIQVVCAASHIEGVRICHTPYEVTGVENLPAPENLRYENGALRWTYDREAFSHARFYYSFARSGSGAPSGRSTMVSVWYDEEAGEAGVDLVNGDNSWNLSANTAYNLSLWAESKDPSLYGNSEKTTVYRILTTAADKLPQPQNITFDDDALTLRWDGVNGCLGFYQANLYLYDGTSGRITSVDKVRTTDTQISLNAYAVKYGAGTYYVILKAYSGDLTQALDSASISTPSLNSPEAWEEVPQGTITVSDTPLPTISLENAQWGPDGHLRWESVEGAAYYEYEIYTRSSVDDPYPEKPAAGRCCTPAYGHTTPSPLKEQVVQLKVRAISADAKRYANGEWSEFSPVYAYTSAPALPALTGKKYNKADRTITWDPITGEDAAYLGGYVVELDLSTGDYANDRRGWTILTRETSVSIDAFGEAFADVDPEARVVYKVWAYSSDLSARNHGYNNSGTYLPAGVQPRASSAPSVTVADLLRSGDSCAFTLRVSGAGDLDRVIAAAYRADGRLRSIRIFDAAASVSVSFTGLEADDVIKVMLTDQRFVPLTSAVPVS